MMPPPSSSELPSIYISLMPGVPDKFARWVEIGAEEEGVPCHRVDTESADLIAAAYQCALASPLKIGVAVSMNAIALHEFRMPPEQSVLYRQLDSFPEQTCRLIGANAARLYVRRPLRLDIIPEIEFGAQSPQANPSEEPILVEAETIKNLVVLVIRKLRERNLL
ncbi:MAG: glycerol dehydratase reactivase beta/small subunit family protein [Chloroflexota bacterium]|jgi:hypothetical protein